MAARVAFTLEPADLHGHRFHVTLRLQLPSALQRFDLAPHAPGSHRSHDFARHVRALQAHQGGARVAVQREGAWSWSVRCSGTSGLPLDLHYDVHAHDSDVAAAFLDGERGFVNGPSLFLAAHGAADDSHALEVVGLPAGWAVATTLCGGGDGVAFTAPDHATLIDHPVAMGRFWQGDFVACGVPHAVVVGGAWPGLQGEAWLADLQALCSAHIRCWHGDSADAGGAAELRDTATAPPFERYLFLVQGSDDGTSGLEHRSSCAVRLPRRDLPGTGRGVSAASLRLLGHEYAHAWIGKRLRPADGITAAPSLLWFIEGFTSHLADWLLLRAGLVDAAHWLQGVAQAIDRLRAGAAAGWPGDASLVAAADPYAAGALVALLSDLALRDCGDSLPAALRRLWERASAANDGVIDEAAIVAALTERAGPPLAESLQAWLHGSGGSDGGLPVLPALARFGIDSVAAPGALASQLGLRVAEGPFSGVLVRQVAPGSVAERAGLAAGDEVLAIDGWRLRRLEDARQWLLPEATASTWLLARDQRLLTVVVDSARGTLLQPLALRLQAAPAPDVLARRQRWLG